MLRRLRHSVRCIVDEALLKAVKYFDFDEKLQQFMLGFFKLILQALAASTKLSKPGVNVM